MALSSAEKKQYRAIGHHLKPVVRVAGNGLSDGVFEELERALGDHELIKVKLAVGDRSVRQAVADEICDKLQAQLVQSIGNNLLLLKKSAKPNPRLSNLLRFQGE